MLPVPLRPGMGAQKSISAPERAGISTNSLTSTTSKQSAEPHFVQGVASTLTGMDSDVESTTQVLSGPCRKYGQAPRAR